MAGDTLSILYEDNHILAVNKNTSDIVQGDRTGDVTLADRVREHLRAAHGKTGNVFVGIPHRLDRPTSGVVIFARTDKALARLSEMFREGGVRKIYWAIVAERPAEDSGSLVHWLQRNPQQNKSYAVAGPAAGPAAAGSAVARGAKEARLHYRLLFSLERYHLLEIELETGRHHQIRAQLAAIGCHIKGDLKYGAARSNPGGGIHLHARQASLVHPVQRVPLVITADPPKDPVWDAVMERWRRDREKTGPGESTEATR